MWRKLKLTTDMENLNELKRDNVKVKNLAESVQITCSCGYVINVVKYNTSTYSRTQCPICHAGYEVNY